MKMEKEKRKRKKNRVIFLSLFIGWTFLLVFNAYTQIISNWINLSPAMFTLIAGVFIAGSVIYGLWLADGGKL